MLKSTNYLFCPEKPGPLGQVRSSALEFHILNNKSQAPPSLKIGPNKSQIPKYKFQTGSKRLFFLFGILNFDYCYLFVFLGLLFGI